ncbi:RNA-directed DNA polymerase from mobile element jockey [Eumeta japonica]|uniref:RNA-directed DNA polymerase from mobile element jockey n=1 Tax=Eumeta variegata TaxID=151549 RepID=A0A4C1UKH8_EUMVA|nr:RNA-directed DNA polymerase from mobile element jockey [Eumeta japonica]
MYNHRTDWDEYRAKITKSVNLNSPLNDVNSIETAIESFNRLIHQAAKESTPFLRQKNLNHFPYPKFIKDKVNERRRLRKIWHLTKYPSDKKAFNHASEDLKNMISQANNERFQNQLADLTPKKDTNYSLWKITKKLKRPKIHIPPIKTTDGKWVRKEAEKAQVFANHLKDVFKPLPSKNTEHDKEVYEYLDAALQMCLPLKSVSPKETWREISKLQEGKTPGYDLVDAKLLKELPEKGIIHFAAICNACLRLAIFPGQWKIAQVVMIPKPGKPLHEASSYRPISLLSVPGVPQGSILGPVLYLIFTADIPTHEDTITATYADDTALLSVDKDSSTASAKLQAHVFKVENWLDKWRIRVNQGKSVHVTFTLRRETCPPIKLHNEEIPQSEDAKYLGMHLDRRLTWRKHIWTKRKQLDTQLRSMYWLMGRKSNLSHESKIAIYKTILKPIWTYGIQLWGTASNSNIEILERFQSKTLRTMLDIPYYVSNKYIHQDLRMNTVKQEIAKHSKNYQMRISTHVNELALNLTGAGSVSHFRLKRHSVPTLAVRFDHS